MTSGKMQLRREKSEIMSFSGRVREELAENISAARHCRIAETAAFIGMCGTVVINSFDRYSIKIHSENLLVARKVFTLIEKTFNIKIDISVRRNIAKQSVSYAVVVRRHEDAPPYPSGDKDGWRASGKHRRYSSLQSSCNPTDVLQARLFERRIPGGRVYERSKEVLSL